MSEPGFSFRELREELSFGAFLDLIKIVTIVTMVLAGLLPFVATEPSPYDAFEIRETMQ